MKKLFIVVLYNSKQNSFTRIAISSHNWEHAGRVAIGAFNNSWKVESITEICQTPDDVFVEL